MESYNKLLSLFCFSFSIRKRDSSGAVSPASNSVRGSGGARPGLPMSYPI
jgi:hypothetical protein